MFRIGDFSKLSQVPVKTLRYYDEFGLLLPKEVDEFTGYRYYSASQMPRLNRIIALKDLGLSLEQIRKILNDGLTSSEIRGMLKMKKAEIEQQVAETQIRLNRVAARLSQIELEGKMSGYDVVVKRIAPQQIASERDVIQSYCHEGELFGRLNGKLAAAGVKIAGPAMSIYYDTEYKETDVDVEAAFPVAGSVSDKSVNVRELEGVEQAACVIHKGSYNTLPAAYSALLSWIEENGYKICGQNRAVYLICGNTTNNEDEFITEVQFPVLKA